MFFSHRFTFELSWELSILFHFILSCSMLFSYFHRTDIRVNLCDRKQTVNEYYLVWIVPLVFFFVSIPVAVFVVVVVIVRWGCCCSAHSLSRDPVEAAVTVYTTFQHFYCPYRYIYVCIHTCYKSHMQKYLYTSTWTKCTRRGCRGSTSVHRYFSDAFTAIKIYFFKQLPFQLSLMVDTVHTTPHRA